MYATTTACTKCYKCVEVCPTRAFKLIDEYPFSCTTCGICAGVCPVGAIKKTRRGGYVVDRARCTLCGLCVKYCPFDFARIKDGRVWGICVRCGKCVEVCPVNARFDVLEVVKKPINYELLLELTSPEKLQQILSETSKSTEEGEG